MIQGILAELIGIKGWGGLLTTSNPLSKNSRFQALFHSRLEEGNSVRYFSVDPILNLDHQRFPFSNPSPRFAQGKVVSLVIDLFPTSWVFKEGHRLRLSIAGADFPTFRLHPRISPANDPRAPTNKKPVVTVWHDPPHPSFVNLPVVLQRN